MKSLVVAFFTLLFFTACQQEFDADVRVQNPTTETDCRDVMCTEEFRTVNIHLLKKNGEAMQLDEFKVFFTETGEEVPNLTDRMLFSDLSKFEIANDALLDEIDFKGTSITFEAKISKLRTWTHEFIIAKDCCHVFSPEGQELEFTL